MTAPTSGQGMKLMQVPMQVTFRDMPVSDAVEAACWKEAEKHFTYQLNCYAKWFSDAGMAFFDPVSSRKELEEQMCQIVTPDEACQKIETYVKETGITRFYGWAVPPGLPPSWSDEHVELMAKEVIPNFR